MASRAIVLAAAVLLSSAALTAPEAGDHLVPESGIFAGYSIESDLWVRHQLVDNIKDWPDFFVVVRPSFQFEWMVSGYTRTGMIRLSRANESIWKAQGRDVKVSTDSKPIPLPLLSRLRDVILTHLANVRHEQTVIDTMSPDDSGTTRIVVTTDGTTYHFVAHSMGGTGTLSGQTRSNGPSTAALEKLVNSVADFASAGKAERDIKTGALEAALKEAESKLPTLR